MRLEPGLWRVGHATRQSKDGSSSADVLLETRRAPWASVTCVWHRRASPSAAT